MQVINAKTVSIHSVPEYHSDHLRPIQLSTMLSPFIVKISHNIAEIGFGIIKLLLLLSTSPLVSGLCYY